jgi:hypothetical protein
LRTARRKRYFVLRVVYGSFLLALISWQFHDVTARYPNLVLSVGDLAIFGRMFFIRFFYIQLFAILAITPAMVAGVIAEEKERKTLHYLMASQLAGHEIVLDKLTARLFQLCLFLAMGVPVLCLNSMLGGVSPNELALAYAATFATIFLAAALSIAISVYARSPRQAVYIAYGAVLIWLILPILLAASLALYLRFTYINLLDVFSYVMLTSPLGLYIGTRPLPGGWSAFPEPLVLILLSAGYLLAGGFLVRLAAQRLRAVFQRQADQPRIPTGFWSRPRGERWRRPRPACAQNGMLWKERYFVRLDRFTKLFVVPVAVTSTVAILWGSGIDEWGPRAIAELWHPELGRITVGPRLFRELLQQISPIYIALWLLAVAGATASSVTSERERDTWTSVVSAPLSGFEILGAKLAGALWRLRWFLWLFCAVWAAGLAVGALDPLGLVAGFVALCAFTGFAGALGLRNSLCASSTGKAFMKTIGTLFALNVVYLLFAGEALSHWNFWTLACTPFTATRLLLIRRGTISLFDLLASGGSLPEDVQSLLWSLVLTAVYGLFAGAIVRDLILSFDARLGRPRRSAASVSQVPPATVSTKKLGWSA